MKILRGILAVLMFSLMIGVASAEQKTKTHIYTEPGTYTGSVTVTDEFGASTTKTITIDVRGNVAPAVTLVADPTSGLSPLTVTFTATATDADGDTMTYTWDFGDQSPPPSDELVQTHTFENIGVYAPSVSVTDTKGNTTKETVKITVKNNRFGC